MQVPERRCKLSLRALALRLSVRFSFPAVLCWHQGHLEGHRCQRLDQLCNAPWLGSTGACSKLRPK
jgi:hypothetical protein